MMLDPVSEAIMAKWAEFGLTRDDVVRHIRNGGASGFVKDAEAGAYDILFKYIPAAAFGIPLVGGALAHMVTHPGFLQDEMRRKRLKDIRDEVEERIRQDGNGA